MEPDFPVDFVYTWVDGEQNAAQRARFLAQTGNAPADATTANRYRDNDELYHSINSVRAFAPWVRRIIVVTSGGQRPAWYRPDHDTDVEFVDDALLFGDDLGGLLPVFNSHAVEAMLHRVPGLAEHLVYFCDDMFLGRPASRLDFFTAEGEAVIRTAGRIRPSWATHRKSWRVYRGNVQRLLRRTLGRQVIHCTTHQALALRRSTLERCWEHDELREALLRTAASRFRSKRDIAPIDLFSNVMLHHGDGVRQRHKGLVICVFDHSPLAVKFLALRLRRPLLYCVNDDMRDPGEQHLARLRRALSTRLPHQRLASPARERTGANSALDPLRRLP